jgi:hypothetical protein
MIMALDVIHLVSSLEFSMGFSLVFNMSVLCYYFIYLSSVCQKLLSYEFFFCKCRFIAQYLFVLASATQTLSIVFYRFHHGLMWLGGP